MRPFDGNAVFVWVVASFLFFFMKILLFAAARDLCQQQPCIDLADAPSNLREVLDTLTHRYPSLAPLLQRCLISVNLQCYSMDDASFVAIQDSDEIAIIPPVSGG